MPPRPHAHTWIATNSVIGDISDLVESTTGITLTHPGYRIFRCECGACELRDYITGQQWPITSEQATVLLG